MRIALNIAFSLLLLPILAKAQSPPPPDQSDPPSQSPAEGQSLLPSSSTPPPTPEPALIPVPVQTRRLYLQPMPKTPVPAAYAPALKVSAGFLVTSLGMPAGGHVALSGGNATISADSGKRFAAELDLSYASAPNVFSSGRHMDVLSYLVGPAYYPSRRDSLSTFFHFLAGGARVAGPFSNGHGGLEAGHVHYPAWAGGGGIECSISQAFALRVSVDYLRTNFFNPAGNIRGQNDIRVVNSILYYPGQLSFRRHH
jgi:hypothetical protein